MKRLIEFPLEDGTQIMVEVEGNEPAGARVRGANAAELAEKARQTLESSMARIKPAAAAIIAKLRELSDKPDEVGVEFGIKLSAEAGAVIASSGIEANFKVNLTWKQSQHQRVP